MAPLVDPALRALYCEALSEWNVDGFIQWKRVPGEWLRANLAGHTQRSLGELMHNHVAGGGIINQVIERRPEYDGTHRFHFDLRFEVDRRRIYIETTLHETKTGPVVTVVSMHDDTP